MCEMALRTSKPDFSRNVYCLFGLPFDAISLDEAVDHILSAAKKGQRYIISTPNVNNIVAAQSDSTFRDSVTRSNLILVDGMPLVWAGRILEIPFPERAAGASLFERLRVPRDGMPLKVYLFGGPAGVAERAAGVLNSENGGVRCVGYASPTYGSVESISTSAYLDDINSSGADFLLIALGTQKGQAWIERNLVRLRPPVISHLGAVVNFIAGTVTRAPGWMQESGGEWLWRIAVEPVLWRRYAEDGRKAFGLLLNRVIPGLFVRLLGYRGRTEVPASVKIQETETEITIGLYGAWPSSSLDPLRSVLECYAATSKSLSIDLFKTTFISSSGIALILLLRRFRIDHGYEWRVMGISPPLARAFKIYGAETTINEG
jgi:N-acetylglucosaminyldiphosphoundecaprenol N-acetyl-beta-D-mannosaminyltransferase